MNLRGIVRVNRIDVCGETCGMIQSIVPYRENDSIAIRLMPDNFVRQ